MHAVRRRPRSAPTSLGSNLSILSKGMILIAIPLVLQVALLISLRQAQASALEAERMAIHSKEVITKADDLLRLVIQTIATQRAAVIAGDPDFEEGLSPAPGEIAGRIAELGALVRDNPERLLRIARVRDQAGRFEAWTASQRQLLREGQRAAAMRRVSQGEGRDHMAGIRDEMTRFLADEGQLDRERTARLRSANQLALTMTTLAAILSLPVAVALVWVFSRGLSSRLAVLTSNASRLAAGEPLAAPVSGDDEIAQLDAVLHDTARRLAESSAAERQARGEAEQRATELAQVNRELSQQTEENELFIYSVSHDLRSPLVNLQGFSRELIRSCDELRGLARDEAVPAALRARASALLDREIPESVHFIRTAVSRSAAIIDALLRLSRIGRVEYRWQPVSVEAVVTTVLDAMRSTINERGASIARLPMEDAWGDPTAIEQVFGNLIGNAVNYLDPARPGRVEIGMVETPAWKIGHGAGTWRTYYVKDNGLGIPAASLPKVFVAFQRLHADAAAGEGIGLAIVRRIVERHRGRVWVESTQDAGTTFYVTLPADAAAVEPPAAAEATGADPDPEGAPSKSAGAPLLS